MTLSQRLDQVIARHDLLQHPFYQAWTEGRLSREALKDYAAQYYAQVEAFPRFVSAVHSRCPELPARKVLLENLVDEELHGTDHPSLWMQFAEGLGLTRDQVRQVERLPQTQQSVDAFFELTGRSWTEGLCALYAYESQVPNVSQSKIDGLKAHYGITDERTLAFFQTHLAYDVAHSQAVAELVNQHAPADLALDATEQAARALWTFLDGVTAIHPVTC